MHLTPTQSAAYARALKHPFRAVAFDVDGTLTHFARFLIPTFMAEALVKIPPHIPRAICTGRDLKFIHTQLEHICSHAADPDAELKRWTVFAENGCVGYRWNPRKKDYDSWFTVPWPKEPDMDTVEAFGKDKLGSSGIFILRDNTVVVRHHDWVYLSARFTRWMSKRSHHKLETVFKKNNWFKKFRVQDSGIGNVIMPIESGKGNAMKRWSKLLKIPLRDFLVVGDQPRPGENDEDFLAGDTGIGFTVGGLTPNTYPLPVLGDRGQHLKGPEGTAVLLGQVRWNQ